MSHETSPEGVPPASREANTVDDATRSKARIEYMLARIAVLEAKIAEDEKQLRHMHSSGMKMKKFTELNEKIALKERYKSELERAESLNTQ